MNPFAKMSEQEEVAARQLCRERFETLFAPLTQYYNSAMQPLDPENRRLVSATADAVRRALEPHGDAMAFLILLCAMTKEAKGWYRKHLAPLEATAPLDGTS